MERTKRFSPVKWLILVTAVVLSFLFATETSLQALADSDTGGRYVAEIITLTAKSVDDAKTKAAAAGKNVGKTYTVFETPIYESDKVKTYIAYTTTNNSKKAIKSIKTMNMNGGWGYSEYNDYLKELSNKAKLLSEDLYTGIKEYVTNLNSNSAMADYAKRLFEFFYEDDSKKTVAEFFEEIATKEYNEVKEQLIKFILQANTSMLTTIENALMLACSGTYKGEHEKDKNFLDDMETERFLQELPGYKNNPEYAIFDTYVQDILLSLEDAQEFIRFYQESGHPYTEEMENVAEMEEEEISERVGKTEDKNELIQKRDEMLMEVRKEAAAEGNPFELTEEEYEAAKDLLGYEQYIDGLTADEKEKYGNGKLLSVSVSECAYTGYEDENGNSEYNSLLDLIMKYDMRDKNEAEKYKNEDFYPLLNAMSDGQRALLKTGFTSLIASIIMPAKLMNTTLDSLLDTVNESIDDENDKIKKGDTVSIYYGVDRSLYEPNSGIALTSAAIAKNKEKSFGRKETTSEKSNRICNIALIASGATAAAAIGTFAGMGLYVYHAVKVAAAEIMSKVEYIVGEIFTQEIYGWTFSVTCETTIVGSSATGPIISQTLFAGGQKFASEGAASFLNTMRSYIAGGFFTSYILGIITAVSIVIMIASVIVKILVPLLDEKETDAIYIDIPRVMCSHQEIYEQKTQLGKEKETDYIYYYGVKNPLLGESEKALAGLDVTKRMIGDIAGWTLKGKSREWVALYASTDSKAGAPILANSFTVTTETSKFTDGLESVKKFNHHTPFDMNSYYGLTINKNLTPKYIGYKMDTSGSNPASVFTRPSLWGGLVAGLILGGGIGTIITYMIFRKKKKENEEILTT